MTRERSRSPKPAPPRASEPPPALIPLAIALPVVLLAAILVGLGVSFRMDDPDIWQHLAVGRAIWKLGSVPHTNLWTWPGYGEPYWIPSWLYRAVLWPVYERAGEWGLMGWRWVVTLATFGLAWLTARRAGARGLAPLVLIVWCAMIARKRSMMRPEMVSALLLAAEIWLLERRRAGDLRAAWWLVPVAMLWANAHISYPIFFEVGLCYLVDAFLRRGGSGASPGTLLAVFLASFAACFVNPWGWVTLWQPFDYVLHQQREPIFQIIGELHSIPWADNVRSGLAFLLALMPVLAFARWAVTRRFDVAESLLYLVFIPQAFQSYRFVATLVVAAAPFLARDAAEVLASVRWPAVSRPPLVRAGLVAAGLLAVSLPELARPTTPIALGFDWRTYPVRPCDWIAERDVRGRAFNLFDQGGYLLWRFWPQHDRLPFMDIHQTGTRFDRDQYALLYSGTRSWSPLDQERRFDWVLLPREQPGMLSYVDALDADSTFVPGFIDDDWVVYLRHDGSMAALADSAGYRWLPGSLRHMNALGDSVTMNPAVRPLVRTELERSIRESPANGHAHSLLANLDLLDGRWSDALAELAAARAVKPLMPALDARERVARDSLAASRH